MKLMPGIALPGAAALLLLPACYDSTMIGHPDAGADADAPAGSCLERCTDPYVAGVIDCHEERRSCLLACGGWDDVACSNPCETTWDACTYERDYEAERCMEDCPCWEPFMACTEECDGGPGDTCWAACESEYGTCSGELIAGMGTCTFDCSTTVMECEMACDDHPPVWEDWVSCTTDCSIAFASCLDRCF